MKIIDIDVEYIQVNIVYDTLYDFMFLTSDVVRVAIKTKHEAVK